MYISSETIIYIYIETMCNASFFLRRWGQFVLIFRIIIITYFRKYFNVEIMIRRKEKRLEGKNWPLENVYFFPTLYLLDLFCILLLNAIEYDLYTNTVLDGSVILSVCLWFCPFAIEATFPLSNFKTKHIFGILVERVTFLKPLGAPEAPEIWGA